jgi:prefoldin alpha subunit
MSEEEFRRTYLESKAIEEYIEALRSRYQLVDASEITLNNAKDALRSISESGQGQSLMVDVGGAVYVRAALADATRVLVGIGEGVYLEKSREDAEKILDQKLESLAKAKETLVQEMNRAQVQYTDKQSRLSSLSQRMSSGQK